MKTQWDDGYSFGHRDATCEILLEIVKTLNKEELGYLGLAVEKYKRKFDKQTEVNHDQ